ncbi:MAG: tyrosine-type recombinase/integrase [Oscillospiraceae bacterium]|nr:tyrosine-type recombinase/integrase [Oscillospiraceae bacterium]
MKKILVSNIDITKFEKHLFNMEKSQITIEKYIRDCKKFLLFAGSEELSKETVIRFKQYIIDAGYAIASVNSMLASVNSLVEFMDRPECRVKSVRRQHQTFTTEDKELTKSEYMRLLTATGKDKRLNLLIQTICCTGIRVSELKYITVAAVRKGETTVYCKNKNRTILIPDQLKKLLSGYMKERKIVSGPVFVTAKGKPLDRSYIWKTMKKLCASAGVATEKVFPHNLRKLFARTFYATAKDIAKLADVLGHSNIATTRIYIMTTFKEHKRRIEQLGLIISDKMQSIGKMRQ